MVPCTVNTVHGVFTPAERFNQLLETFPSIRKKVPNCKIVCIDNSLEPLTLNQQALIESQVDIFIQYQHDLFSTLVNTNGLHRGLGELLMYEKALAAMKEHHIIGKRIFKITGRYQLADTFDIRTYDDPLLQSKYALRVRTWRLSMNSTPKDETFFETRFWSLCYTLYDEYLITMQSIFENIMTNLHCIEMANFQCIPHDKVISIQNLHVFGYLSDGALIED